MFISKLSKNHMIAIKEASQGLISGRLSEWFVLRDAFRLLELPHNGSMKASEARNISILVYRTFVSSIDTKIGQK